MNDWVRAPGTRAASRWLTRPDCRTVLVVVPHVTAGTRLADLLPLLEADHRIQVVATVPSTSDSWPDADAYVRGWDGIVLPWHQVLRMRFDLALAASHVAIDAVDAPVLVVPHGVGTRSRLSPWASPDGGGLRARDVLMRDGRVVPSVAVVAHERDARRWRDECPEAADRILVGGDPCFDRMRASLPFRTLYREALGVAAKQKLVLVSSTWSRHSLFGAQPSVFGRLATELPGDRFRVAAALHPNVWSLHGRRQVRAWLREPVEAGLTVLDPEEGWRAALVAADYLIGDHGSVTQYGAAVGLPVLLSNAARADVAEGSVAAYLASAVPALDDTPLLAQLATAAASGSRSRARAVARRVTSEPGGSARILRRAMYEILRLTEPARQAVASPVPMPPGYRSDTAGEGVAAWPTS